MGTVLVAEDSKTIRTIVTWLFKGQGHSVKSATTGAEVLANIHEQRPDLLVLDYSLPDQDALELCRSLKSKPDASSMAVLMMGGSYQPFDAAQAQAAGADDTILKPFLSKDFLDKVSALVEQAQAGQAARLGASAPAPAATPTPMDSPPTPAAPIEGVAAAAPASSSPRFQFPSRGGASTPPPRPQAPASPKTQPAPAASPAPAAQPEAPKRFSFPSKKPEVKTSAPDKTPATPTPAVPPVAPSAHQTPAAPAAPAAPVEIDQAMLRAEVQKAVKEMLPGTVRGILKELITREVIPHLQKWVEGKVEAIVRSRMR